MKILGFVFQIDSVDRPSWQAQISGKKSWALIPPAECESICHPLNITMNKGDVGRILSFITFFIKFFDKSDFSNDLSSNKLGRILRKTTTFSRT